jgi:phosphoribosylamine---glycine ligase
VRALILGGGGRESALAWALSRSRSIEELVAAPGNAGIASFATTLQVAVDDPAAVAALAEELRPGLVVIGPEAPLVAGVGDALRSEGFNVFGPSAGAARIEGSKSYAKELMKRAGIATARGKRFDSVTEAVAFMDELGPPYVIKADGLAAGKGVVVTEDRDRAMLAMEERIEKGVFGDAGRSIVVEEFLDGQELSLIAVSDGRSVVACEPAQDYKRVNDNDEGPNTGGMGSYSPVPACPPPLAEQIVTEIIEPMVAATGAAGHPFSGALYAGLALTSKGPKVVEFNVRFGDPETQALIPRLQSDFGELCLACATGDLSGTKLDWSTEACVSVVLASGGYPGDHETGVEIRGIDAASARPGVHVFHAGTAGEDGRLVTAGGRVLAVSAIGTTFGAARTRAYDAARLIEFKAKHARTDIALRAELTERAEA